MINKFKVVTKLGINFIVIQLHMFSVYVITNENLKFWPNLVKIIFEKTGKHVFLFMVILVFSAFLVKPD